MFRLCWGKGTVPHLSVQRVQVKPSVLRLIYKTYQDYEGSILLNGIELSNLKRRLCSLVLNDARWPPYLKRRFSSILLWVKEHLTRVEVEQAALYVYADKFIEQFTYRMQIFHLERMAQIYLWGNTAHFVCKSGRTKVGN
ncbi:hypothetical protein O9929_24055 [Vibrio lentus]|nr:hypothetical protein [Vibrio lentus]